LGTGGALGGPAHLGENYGGKTSNLGAAPHDRGFAKKRRIRKTTQAAKHSLHQLRKRRHVRMDSLWSKIVVSGSGSV